MEVLKVKNASGEWITIPAIGPETLIPSPPTEDGKYILSLKTEEGTPVYSWVTIPAEGFSGPYNEDPEMNGAASPGEAQEYARGDHVHPAAPVSTITVPTSSYDTTKISSVTVIKVGKIVSGKIIISASALAPGHNSITFSIPDVSWATTPSSSCWTVGASDASKNYYSQVGSSLYIMASESNNSTIAVFFTGICA